MSILNRFRKKHELNAREVIFNITGSKYKKYNIIKLNKFTDYINDEYIKESKVASEFIEFYEKYSELVGTHKIPKNHIYSEDNETNWKVVWRIDSIDQIIIFTESGTCPIYRDTSLPTRIKRELIVIDKE